MVDTLANSLTQEYDVTIVCPDGGSSIAYTINDLYQYNDNVLYTKFAKVNYYLVKKQNWEENTFYLLQNLEVDIFHNCSTKAHFIYAFQKRKIKSILTFDTYKFMPGTTEVLNLYDYITTVSKNYAEETLMSDSKLGNYLKYCNNFIGITNGISEVAFNPNKGILMTSHYNSIDQKGKAVCKKYLLQNYGIKDCPCIYTMMCRLVDDKNINAVLEVLPLIKKNNGFLIIVGKGEPKYEKLLKSYSIEDGLLFIDRFASPMQAPALLSGSDFYLSPSIYEPCGLMPMSACIYGTIPIVSQVGGLKDNFNEDNSILIKESLEQAILESTKLYEDKDLLFRKRQYCMRQKQFFWDKRKQEYIKLYES